MAASFIPLTLAAASAGCSSSGDDSKGSANGGSSTTAEGGATSSSGGSASTAKGGATSSGGAQNGSGGSSAGANTSGGATTADGPPAGYPDGHAAVPDAGKLEDVSKPTTVVGTGTPASCTAEALVAAVAQGGIITFDCGAEPVTITMSQPAKVFNDKGTKLVIDGGNKVTLSGAGKTRILYMATCNKAQVYPPGSGDCNTNPGVQLVVQNLTFVNGSAKGIDDANNAGGGGAIYAQGGSLKVVNCRFFNNVCDDLGSDVGGGAIRKLDYLVAPGAGPKRPVWVVNSTFGGRMGLGNSCANGGALSSIGVSWNILNSVFSYNVAVGHGANSGQGGNGGAIYNDGNEIVLDIKSSLLENNQANEGGSAVFFVSNDKSGSITLTDSLARNNPRGTFETANLPGFYVIAKQPAQIVNSMILR
ncbi:MAG TPA: hypothetical protein VFQ35_08935 [Polyangiaceae bacterium]|nr:hypothetical protein [Polyangiaceae bacterium]